MNRAKQDKKILERKELVLRLPGKKCIISDLDGTIFNCDGVRSPYDEKKVILDNTYPVVVKWIQELYKDFNVFLVSGRHNWCAPDTVTRLEQCEVPYDLLLMRESNDNRSDYIIKNEILQLLLTNIKKEDIFFVLDDRPQVGIKCWQANGIKVIPVRGSWTHAKGCTFDAEYSLLNKEGKKLMRNGMVYCPKCSALLDF